MSTFGSVFELSSLNGTNGFQINGGAENDLFGFSVASAGDVDGDGFADLIIGAPTVWVPNASTSGSAYVIFGKEGGFAPVLDLTILNGSTGFELNGEAAGDGAGTSVASAGDMNGDGFADLIVGARRADRTDPDGEDAGASYVIFGKADGFGTNLDLSALDGTNGFQISGEAADDFFGRSVASAGDVNGDGFGDIIIGAAGADANVNGAGASYVVFGKADGFVADLSLSALDGNNGFRISGAAAFDYAGESVSSAGDVNGDGFADLIIGASRASANGLQSGVSYVVFGKERGFAANLDPSMLDGSAGFRISGEAAGDLFGVSVAAAGDVNGDGFGDLIIGASLADANGDDSGAAYVVFGKAGGFGAELSLSALDGGNGFQIVGATAGDKTGYSVASAGDVNGDGFADLIIGAYRTSPNGTNSGSSYVLFGKAGGFGSELNLSTLGGTSGFRISGEAAGDYAGNSVGAAGDVNGDGFDDLIVGAVFADPNGNRSGASYIIFGMATAGTARDDMLEASGIADRLSGLAGNDTIRGNGGADTLNGGDGNDLIFGGTEGDILVGGAGDDLLDGGSGLDSLYGGSGNDVFVIDSVSDVIRDGAGIDELRSSSASIALASAAVAGIENARLTGSGNLSLSGTAGANALTGNNGNNTLEGGGGADVLAGAAGNDTYITDGADTITEAADGGTDTVFSAVTITLGVNLENLSLSGLGAINGTGNALVNRLTGNGAANVLDGGSGADVLIGGAGNDTYVIDGGDTISEGVAGVNLDFDTVRSSVTFTLGTNLEYLVLTGSGAINGTGNALANRVTGNAAANVLSGGTGADVLIGGAGNDTYVTDGGDTITEGLNAGYDEVQSSATLTLGANLEHLVLTGSGAINGTGNTLANALTGNTAANVLSGGDAQDYLDGGGGADVLIGGRGNDNYVTDGGDTIVEGANAGTDSVQSLVTLALAANLENLSLIGSAAINGTGNTLDNRLSGNPAANVLIGGGGNDRLYGYTGNDTYVTDGGDTIIEDPSAGRDTVQSSATLTLGDNVEDLILTGSAAINGTGNSLANTLSGNRAANVLSGGFGADTLTGGRGADVLDGGDGADTLTGGLGADSFVFRDTGSSSNADRITDFNVADDMIRLEVFGLRMSLGLGVLPSSAFVRSLDGSALDRDDRVIYETDTGKIYFDRDGSGGDSRDLLATIAPNLALTAADFLIV